MANELKNKLMLKELNKRLYRATPDTVGAILSDYYSEDAVMHSFHPLNLLEGRESIVEKFYKPFLTSFPDVSKNAYILMAGSYKGEDWVSSTGNFVGTFKEDWLDIPSNDSATWIRFGEFHKIVDGKIVYSE